MELTALSPKNSKSSPKAGSTKIDLWNYSNQKQTYDVVVLPNRNGAMLAKHIATEVAEQIASLKSKYPQLKNFSAEQHLRKNTMHDGYNPGSPNNPELYSISYQNGVVFNPAADRRPEKSNRIQL